MSIRQAQHHHIAHFFINKNCTVYCVRRLRFGRHPQGAAGEGYFPRHLTPVCNSYGHRHKDALDTIGSSLHKLRDSSTEAPMSSSSLQVAKKQGVVTIIPDSAEAYSVERIFLRAANNGSAQRCKAELQLQSNSGVNTRWQRNLRQKRQTAFSTACIHTGQEEPNPWTEPWLTLGFINYIPSRKWERKTLRVHTHFQSNSDPT